MIVENIRMAFSSLVSNKLRTLLSLLGIIIGISSVVTVSNLGSSLTSYMEDMFSDMGANVMTLYSTPEESSVADLFTFEFGESLQIDRPEIAQVVPVESDYFRMKVKDDTAMEEVLGVTANFKETAGFTMASGRFFTDIENYEQRAVVVLGSAFATDYFPFEDPVGEMIRVYSGSNAYLLEVIGVLEAKDAMTSGSFVDRSIIIPYNTYTTRLDNVDFVSRYDLEIAEGHDLLLLEDVLEQYLTNRVGEDNFELSSSAMLIDMQMRMMGIMQVVILAIASISLVVGGIGIMNIMLVTVVERVKEIGVRKALGATPGNILGQFLIEAMMVTFFGGIFGLLAGFGLSSVLAEAIELTLRPNISFAIFALLFSTGIGVFFGIYPAWKAAKLDPIVALNHE